MGMRRLALIVGMVSVGGCGYREVAPPQAPAKEMPGGVEERTAPPEAATTRVILDANGERATVTEIVSVTRRSAYGMGEP